MKFSLTTDYLHHDYFVWASIQLLITKLSSVIYMYYAYVHYAHSGVKVVVALSSEKPRNKTPILLSAYMVRHNELNDLHVIVKCIV